jgi:hypothetical protein
MDMDWITVFQEFPVAKVIFLASCGRRVLHKLPFFYVFEQFLCGNGSSFSKSTGHVVRMMYVGPYCLMFKECSLLQPVALFTFLRSCFSHFSGVASQ